LHATHCGPQARSQADNEDNKVAGERRVGVQPVLPYHLISVGRQDQVVGGRTFDQRLLRSIAAAGTARRKRGQQRMTRGSPFCDWSQNASRRPARRVLLNRPAMSAFRAKRTWPVVWIRSSPPLLTQCMVRPCVARELSSSWRMCGLASMYPAFDWSIWCSWPSWISARVRAH
jgi:hypothetical protein